MEKIQIINSNWWYMYDGFWKDLGVKASGLKREQVRASCKEVIDTFVMHCEDQKRRRFTCKK